MNLSFLVNDPSWCLGSGQEIINFCSSCEGAWPGPGGYSLPPQLMAGAKEKDLSSRGQECLLVDISRGTHPILTIIEGFFLLNCLLSCMLFQQYFCCYCECYLIAIYSKLSLPQPAIFAPLCFQFSRSCPRGGGSRETGNQERAESGLESLDGDTDLGNTIPKP